MSNPDEYQSIPVAAARAAVQASGELEGIEGPLFLADNESDWLPYYIGRYDPEAMPLMAKVVITRKGQKPREVVISWDEYAAELDETDPEWAQKRRRKPMSIFGAEVERHAYRVAFADVLAAAMPRHIVAPADAVKLAPGPDRMMVVPDDRPAAGWGLPARDWFAEVKAADAAKLNGLYDEARDAGALVKIDGLQQAFTDRMLELSKAPAVFADVDKPKTEPRPQGQGQRRRRGKR